MRTARFVEVAPPLERQVSEGFLARVREALTLTERVQSQFNQTIHDEELKEKTATSAVDALRPGTLTFGLIVLMIAVVVAKRLIIKRETAKILLAHGYPLVGEIKQA